MIIKGDSLKNVSFCPNGIFNGAGLKCLVLLRRNGKPAYFREKNVQISDYAS
tara:strand:- start:302 stop:457 length:156 start_codon:yes stop_codon:yes gene_type:complete